MAFNISATLDQVVSYLKADGRFPNAQVGEFKQPPSTVERLAAAVWMDRAEVVLVFADGGTREKHVVTLRVYKDMLEEPEVDVEKGVAVAISEISSDLLGDYDLGGTIMSIDAAGAHGTSYGAAWGYVEVSGRMYRIADITLPLIVDDSSTLSP